MFNSCSTHYRSNNMGTIVIQEIIVSPPRIPLPGLIDLQRQSFQFVHKALLELEAFVI